MCRVLKVTRQGYYAWKNAPLSNHAKRDIELLKIINKLHQEHWGVYGAPRIYALLRREGIRVSKKRVARIMSENGIVGAAKRHKPSAGLIHHSDHGSQYCSLLLGKTLESRGIVPSMGAIASPWDNAITESLMSTIKSEYVHHKIYATKEEAYLEIFEYIESFYNRLRLHSALGNVSPLEFEEVHARTNFAA